jgi:hypothetical protein
MHFSSSVDVIVDEKNELFHAVSVYVPMSLAEANIAGFDPAWVTAAKPAVFTCVLDNYKEIMKGKLLDQWADAFRQDTNTSLILYAVVFLDDASTAGMWEIDDVSITFAPLTNAFNKLFFISYVKTLFDESYTGESYFDAALALAYLCKLDNKLSYFIPLVKVSYTDQKPNPSDKCLIRAKTSAEEKAAMTSLDTGDRTKYFWGALYLMNCVQNTWVLVHSEPVNIIPLIFAAWFAARNASGQFVGNKLSLLRLRGTRIKPLGFPSWLNSEVNENDADGFGILDAKNVGYLCTIADNTPQESCVSSARSINGTPVAAQMISKWVDYTSAQQCAKFITEDGTLTDPVLTDEEAYKKVQDIVFSNLLLFAPTKRVNNIVMQFPPFATAKTGLTALEAASSWKAGYTDDLDEVTVTGGIVAG